MSQPDTFTIAETCELIDRSRWTVHRLIKAGQLTARKTGTARNGEVRIARTSIERYLAGHALVAEQATN